MARKNDALPERAPDPSPAPPAAASGPKGPVVTNDLSAEIARAVDRQPEDKVRCTRVANDTYRCNWWAPQDHAQYDNPAMAGPIVTTHRVRKSQFLRATKSPAGLVITICVPGTARG